MMARAGATITIEAGKSWRLVRDQMRAEVELMKGLLAMAAQIKFSGPSCSSERTKFRVERISEERSNEINKLTRHRLTLSWGEETTLDGPASHGGAISLPCSKGDAAKHKIGDEFYLTLIPAAQADDEVRRFREAMIPCGASSMKEILDQACNGSATLTPFPAPPLEQVGRALRFACQELVKEHPLKWPGIPYTREKFLRLATARFTVEDAGCGAVTRVLDGASHVATFTGSNHRSHAREYCHLLNDRHWRQIFGEQGESPLRAAAA